MRSSKTFVLINSTPWLFDYKSGRSQEFPSDIISLLGEDHEADSFNWSPLDAWTFWMRNIRYIDYDDYESVVLEDRKLNECKHLIEKQPEISPSHTGDEFDNVNLPVPFGRSRQSILAALSSLLYCAFGSLKEVGFHEDIVHLKAVPSVGARHGIETDIVLNKNIYHYACDRHKLMFISSDSNNTNSDVLKMKLWARPEVYAWRYENPECLIDMYLDIGHILANLSLVADIYDMQFEWTDGEASAGNIFKRIDIGTVEFTYW